MDSAQESSKSSSNCSQWSPQKPYTGKCRWNQQFPFSSPETHIPAPISVMNGHQSGGKLFHIRGRDSSPLVFQGLHLYLLIPVAQPVTEQTAVTILSNPPPTTIHLVWQSNIFVTVTPQISRGHTYVLSYPAATSPPQVLTPYLSHQLATSSLFCHLPTARGQVREAQDLGLSPSPAPPVAKGLTCSEFSGYSCRTARAPRTCKQQNITLLQTYHGLRAQHFSLPHSLNI